MPAATGDFGQIEGRCEINFLQTEKNYTGNGTLKGHRIFSG
jgi:hypothetical protein